MSYVKNIGANLDRIFSETYLPTMVRNELEEYIKTYAGEISQPTVVNMAGFTGRMVRDGAEVIMFFKVGGKYYPATNANNEAMDAYLHTGDTAFLSNLEKEVEL